MDDNVIANMRSRVEMCRRLAARTHDREIAETLRRIADEGEADIRRLETEQRDSSAD